MITRLITRCCRCGISRTIEAETSRFWSQEFRMCLDHWVVNKKSDSDIINIYIYIHYIYRYHILYQVIQYVISIPDPWRS